MRGEMAQIGELGKVAAVVCTIAWQAVCLGELPATGKSPTAQILEGHQGAVLDAVISHDGQKLVSAGNDGTVRLWDLTSKKEVTRFEGHKGPVRHLVFTPDGSKVLTGGEDGTVRLWDASTGKQLECLTGNEGPVTKMIIAPDGRQLIVCGNDGTIRIWPLPGPKQNWGPEQATGAPDTPAAGDQVTAWASATPDNQAEWLLLQYEKPVKAVAVHVYESYNPGALTKVTVFDGDGKEITVWEGSDPVDRSKPVGVSRIPIDVDFAVERVKLYLDSPNVGGWNEIDAVGLLDEKEETHWAVSAEASSSFGQFSGAMFDPYGSIPQPTTALPPLPPVVVPENAVKVSHVDDTAEGKQSYGGSGFAVRFDRPESANKLVAIELFASRYGLPQAPNEDIHVYLLDDDFKVLHDLAYPYRTFERGEERWYLLGVDSLEVPERFHIGFFFNAHQTKGIYMGKDTDVKESHSFQGTVEKGYKPVDGKFDWMVRTYFVPAGPAR